MSDDDLCYISANEALTLFRDRSLSPVELTRAIISRADAISSTVNPFADCYFDEASDRAASSEKKYASRATEAGKLEGIPLAVKDSSSSGTQNKRRLTYP